MTRIVSGFAGSLTLRVPKNGTRPTSDRVREAIFSALDARDAIAGLRVLDLYAGSGALGLEAASRGARVVTLVEKNPQAAALCRANAAAVAKAAPRTGAPQITVSGQSVQGFLDGTSAGFDLVFIDPPYELSAEELAENLRALAPRLHEEAVVMVERSSRSPEPEWPSGLELDRRKDYGDTTLWWAHTVAEQPGA
ncbi:16S rRNA (guanine966-N2)-methyltransferase [Microterricola gilva]|uniref:16S rRNA (Guanine966-N2)-methyltransferase n=1 Tax=Microterricola gilva TaxID=393267 RepID=A0A4Q8ALH0_9MICO|nr:16S rRNA (guanine(966)-N(2))-methyltransferase RsmD [Microterricola gilva]RZU64735.1 16S rRNA (guanine966-N2)-methyltransferase [Microterricola gilva]